MPVADNRGIGRLLTIALSVLALASTAGCSDDNDRMAAEQRWYEYNAKDDHKGSFDASSRQIAGALSMTSGELPGNETPLQAAINCTVALRSTIANLENAQGTLGAAETAALREAQTEYARRAGSLAASESETRQGVQTLIEERFEVRKDQAAPQAQLAMACLSNLVKS